MSLGWCSASFDIFSQNTYVSDFVIKSWLQEKKLVVVFGMSNDMQLEPYSADNLMAFSDLLGLHSPVGTKIQFSYFIDISVLTNSYPSVLAFGIQGVPSDIFMIISKHAGYEAES